MMCAMCPAAWKLELYIVSCHPEAIDFLVIWIFEFGQLNGREQKPLMKLALKKNIVKCVSID